MPIYAECGGMMSLSEQLLDTNGSSWKMAGLLPGVIQMQKKLQALGLQSLNSAHGELRGHTFHFSRFETYLTPSRFTSKQVSPLNSALSAEVLTVGEAIYQFNGLHASYFHAYFPSNPRAAAHLFLKST
jgi:cobyrinic acid a,c-diamide synthase